MFLSFFFGAKEVLLLPTFDYKSVISAIYKNKYKYRNQSYFLTDTCLSRISKTGAKFIYCWLVNLLLQRAV